MAGGFLTFLTAMAMERRRNLPTKSDSTFQQRPRHDLESLIWMVVYAMMIHHRNNLAATDPEMCELHNIRSAWMSVGRFTRTAPYTIPVII